MVDFKKLLESLSPEEKEKRRIHNENLHGKTLTSFPIKTFRFKNLGIKRNKTIFSEPKEQICVLYLKEIDNKKIIKLEGGPTGYESFNLDEFIFKWINSPETKFWCACQGGMGWDKLEVPIEEMRRAFKEMGLL